MAAVERSIRGSGSALGHEVSFTPFPNFNSMSAYAESKGKRKALTQRRNERRKAIQFNHLCVFLHPFAPLR
jgi:hypothetical protein